jgi:hypothetical protein
VQTDITTINLKEQIQKRDIELEEKGELGKAR